MYPLRSTQHIWNVDVRTTVCFGYVSIFTVSTQKSLRCTEPGGEIHSMQMTNKVIILH